MVTNPFDWNEDLYSVDLSETNYDRRQGTPVKVITMIPGKRKKEDGTGDEVFFVDLDLAGLTKVTLEIKRGDQLKSKVRQFCYSQSKFFFTNSLDLEKGMD